MDRKRMFESQQNFPEFFLIIFRPSIPTDHYTKGIHPTPPSFTILLFVPISNLITSCIFALYMSYSYYVAFCALNIIAENRKSLFLLLSFKLSHSFQCWDVLIKIWLVVYFVFKSLSHSVFFLSPHLIPELALKVNNLAYDIMISLIPLIAISLTRDS